MKMSAAFVAVALLVGCGGSGGDPTDDNAAHVATTSQPAATTPGPSAGDTTSATAWSKRVEAICVKSAAKAAEAGKRLRRRSAAAGDSEQELAYKVLTLTANLVDPWLDEIQALPKPEGHERDANKFISSMHSVGDLLGKAATAIKQNDQTTGKKLVSQLKAKSVSVRTQARALGIEECNPPSA